MYSRKICEKCNLTLYAKSQEKFESIDSRCNCDSGRKKLIEHIGTRRLCSKHYIRWVIDDYESNG